MAEQDSRISKVLDCPCGSGRMVDLLLKWQLTCADIDDARLEALKSYYPDQGIETVLCDVFGLPFEDDQFDLVLCCGLTQHIEKNRLPEMFRQLRRVTKKWLLITYPAPVSLSNLYYRSKRKAKTKLTRNEFMSLLEGSQLKLVQHASVLPLLVAGRLALVEKV